MESNNEREFFVMKLGENNNKMRQYTKETVQEWINALKEKKVKNYKIEYVVNVQEGEVKSHFINSNLYCGVVTNISIRDNEVYATAKFKVKGQYAEMIKENPEFFDNLTLVPKGYGKVKDNIVFDYELYGFNLVEAPRSAFYVEKEKKEQEG